jgi:hypothetical protein
MKWKHLCKENVSNSTKGKIPKWYNILVKKVTNGSDRYLNMKYMNRIKGNEKNDNIVKLTGEITNLFTWNNANNEPIFSLYKKNHVVKTVKL